MEQVTLWSHETVLTAQAGSAAKARNFVVHQLVEHRLLYMVDDVRLVASELAANAVMRTQSDFTVILEGRENSVLLTVRDGPPIASAPSPDVPYVMRIAGRGLLIVNMRSQAWGVAGPDATGKSVWASFPTRSRAVS
jgi:hypothetical protein